LHGIFLQNEMKKLLSGICLLVVMGACVGGKKQADTVVPDVAAVDSVPDELDTVVWMDDWKEEEPDIPAKADELFDDFLYNFAIDEKLQEKRIVFPLAWYKDDRKDSIAKDEWIYDPLFSRYDSYTVLYDQVKDMEVDKGASSTSVQIEWIYLQDRRIRRYYFERVDGDWILEAIDDAAMPKEEEESENFYEFYARFVGDSVFQAERVSTPLPFVTLDPEDEFQVLETTLNERQWFAFQPTLSKEYLTNVNYGQGLDNRSKTRIVELKGFGNGFYNTLHFRRKNGVWMLVRFEDLGD